MLEVAPERRDPPSVPAGELFIPEELELSFGGWPPETFALLERLRAEPHIGQYRKERDSGRLDRYLKEPFKHYRDDLVVNWVLPNRLKFETEKNVFSRLLKNDFGAGGCHHHKWMAFYRPGRKRLRDVQLSHSLWPHGLEVGCYVGGYMKDLLEQARTRIAAHPDEYLAAVNPLLEEEDWRFYFYRGSGARREKRVFTDPLGDLPEDIERADGIWVRRHFPQEEVLRWEEALIRRVLEALQAVWPVYRFYLDERRED